LAPRLTGLGVVRADRLVAMMLLLQSRGRMTAASLAEELEVSVATARRDLEALSAAGIPVYPQPGRGGGWALVGGARTDLSGLSAAEARALFVLAGPAATVVPEVRSALRKLVRALPDPFRPEAEAAARAVVIDPASWGERTRERPPMVDLLQAAVVQRRRVELVYADRTRRRTRRLVEPWGLADKDDVWYLVAGTDEGQRTFRVDRVIDAVLTDVPAEPPAGFDLSAAWERVVEDMERRRYQRWATVLVGARHVDVLRKQYGRHFHLVGPVDNDAGEPRVRARVAAPTAGMLAQHLAGWGGLVEVEEPDSVRMELARIGSELSERYSGAEP
jgi:predicted DNA-binding transcriptional regulator YafY